MSLDEILKTLDQYGQCEGLPWMPEMLPYCGQTVRVVRWANSVCIFGDQIQFRHLDNCVVLDMPRCCGSDHGHCQMGCAFFWKTQWLRPAMLAPSQNSQNHRPHVSSPQLVELMESGTRTARGFRCQATRLAAITTQQGHLKRVTDEYNLNRMNVSSFVADFCSSLLAKATRRPSGLRGPHDKKTPAMDIGLQPGDVVRVRSKEEIEESLNANGMNRGLWFDPVMLRFCRKSFQVSRRVERFISETSGKMIKPPVPSIVLEDLHCDGRGRRNCSRLLQFFWREIWLQRVDDSSAT